MTSVKSVDLTPSALLKVFTVTYATKKSNPNRIRLCRIPAREEIEKAFDIKVSEKENELFLTALRGDTCIPELIRTIGEKVLSVRLQRPTLNDVFLKLTGREIRAEEASASDTIREAVRSYRRRFDRG